MALVNLKSIYPIAKKEFIDHIRNKWILALVLIFIILTVVASYQAGGKEGTEKIFGGMEDTVITLIGIATFLIPIIAIMLGYGTIAGEAESGALSIVLSYPVKRIEILLGKIIGLGSVLIFSTFVGFGIGGILITATVGASEGVAYLVFICLTILVGFIYLCLAVCFSAICKKRVTSVAAGILIFFWSMIYGMIIMGIYLGTSGKSYEQIMVDFQTGNATFPDWLWGSVIVSPSDLYQSSVMKAFEVEQAFGFTVEEPAFMTMGFILIFMLIWVIVPMILAYVFFKRRDI